MHEARAENWGDAILIAAQEYATRGWCVLPLQSAIGDRCACSSEKCASIGKRPLVQRGVHAASSNHNQISAWWGKTRAANIGIATGQKSGIVVIDIDPRHGGDKAWEAWATGKDLPGTLQVETGGGGRHLYYRVGENSIGNRTNVLPGVDVRGDGGYVVAPPSIHASGRAYSWAGEFHPDGIAELPYAVRELITAHNDSHATKKAEPEFIPEGVRNDTLAGLAGVLRKRGLTETGICAALNVINIGLCTPPLEAAEISAISKSISKYEPTSSMDLEWSEPRPLPQYNIKTLPLRGQDVPASLRPWLEDLAERMQVPLEFVAAPAIVTLSSLIGRQIGIYPKQKDNWLVIPNLWGAVIARPGFFKSPAIAEAMKPIDDLAKQEHVKYEAAAVVAKAREDILKAKIEGLKESVKKTIKRGNFHEVDEFQRDLEQAYRDLEAVGVREKRFKTNDATVEKLACLLNDNPNGMLVVRDELSGWLSNMNKVGREGDRDFYLEAWNGYGAYSVDRIGRGTLHVSSLCVSVFGGLQPGKLDAYVSQALAGGKGDDGLLQRFQILVYPETPKKWKNIDRRPDKEAYENARRIFQRLATLKVPSVEGKQGAFGLRFDKDGQESFDAWRETLEVRLRGGDIGSTAFESHLAKYRSLVPSLALLFQLVELAIGKYDGAEASVGLESVELAIRWALFLESHAHKIYEKASNPEINGAQILAQKIKESKVNDHDSLRTMYRHNWAQLNSLEKMESAISVLEDCGWVKIESFKSGSKFVDKIRINPKLRQSGAA